MGLFFTYIIKSTICLTLFYLFYRLLLSRDTFHRFNRIALLSLILLSVVIPFVRISTPKASAIQSPMINLEQYLLLMDQSPIESTQSWGLQLFIILYLLGTAFFICKLIYSAYTIIRIVKSGEKIQLHKTVSVIVTNNHIAPFSWMRYIVISRMDWEENKEEIITHELAHINYRHSWDVLLSGICVVFHWFNPAAWLLKQELQNIHEYEADEKVINQGIDAKRYQLLLIKKAVGTQRFTSMANSFNHSKLKKRITMMLKSKSNTWARLKYLYVLPLAAIAITAFARPEISRELEKISSTKISKLPLIKEVIPPKKVSVAPVAPIALADTLNPAKIDADQLREDFLKSVSERVAVMEEQISLEEAKIQELVDKALAEVDMEEQLTALQKEKLNEQVEKAIKESEKKIQQAVKEQEKAIKEQEKAVTMSMSASLAANRNIVLFIDDVRTSPEELENLNPDDILSVTVQKNKELAKEYGEDMEAVIFIKTKKKE